MGSSWQSNEMDDVNSAIHLTVGYPTVIGLFVVIVMALVCGSAAGVLFVFAACRFVLLQAAFSSP